MTTVALLNEPSIKLISGQQNNALLRVATPFLETILKVRAHKLIPSRELRSSLKEMVQKFTTQAQQFGYTDKQLKHTRYVLAAFIDEAVLTEQFTFKNEWENNPFQLECFGDQKAGIVVFECINLLLGSKEKNDCDVLEIYYICLLLGYRGKYKIGGEEPIKILINDIFNYLNDQQRIYHGELSPHWKATDQPTLPPEKGLPLWLKLSISLSLGLLILLYLIYTILLNSALSTAKEQLLR